MAQFNVEDQTGNHPWKNHDGKGDQGKDERQMKAANIAIRPKTRIRRSMTACNTCRKLKTRCDLEPRSHACRRCLSLRIECELPEAAERNQENALTWTDRTSHAPSTIEERLSSLEQSMRELTDTVRQMMESRSDSSRSPVFRSSKHGLRTAEFEETSSEEGFHLSPFVPRPVHLIGELQSEIFGEKEDHTSEAYHLGDIVTKGLVDSDLALRLMGLFVTNFGSWISVYNTSDLPQNLRQNHPLLFSTACLLASRHVPEIPLALVHAMYHQVRRLSETVLWSAPPLKYESLQALVLLCLWASVVQTGVPMDSWLLSGISIDHATIAFGFPDRIPAEATVSDDQLKKLRLWNAFCLTQLHFAIGNGRPLNLQQKYLDYCSRVLEHSAVRFEDARMIAEIRLYSITLSLQNNSQRIQNCEGDYEEITNWKKDCAHLFNEPLSTLDLGLWFCQLLLHRTSLRLQSNNETHLPEVINNARLIISRFLQIRPHLAVAFIDHIFFVVTYAALTLCEFDVLYHLIDQIQVFLMTIAPNEEHIAYRFACVINGVRRRFVNPAQHRSDDIKDINFDDSNSVELGASPSISALGNTIPERYGTLGQLLEGFTPSQATPSPVYIGVSLADELATTMTQQY